MKFSIAIVCADLGAHLQGIMAEIKASLALLPSSDFIESEPLIFQTVAECEAHLSSAGYDERNKTFVILTQTHIQGSRAFRPFAPGFSLGYVIRSESGVTTNITQGVCISQSGLKKGFRVTQAARLSVLWIWKKCEFGLDTNPNWYHVALSDDPKINGRNEFPWGFAPTKKSRKRSKKWKARIGAASRVSFVPQPTSVFPYAAATA